MNERSIGNDDRPQLVVRLRERAGRERIGTRPERYVLEVGLEGVVTIATKEGDFEKRTKARMAGFFFNEQRDLPTALRWCADNFEQRLKRDPATSGRIVVPQFGGIR